MRRISKLKRAECVEYLAKRKTEEPKDLAQSQDIQQSVEKLARLASDIWDSLVRLRILYRKAGARRSFIQRLKFRAEESTFLFTLSDQYEVNSTKERLQRFKHDAVGQLTSIYSKSLFLAQSRAPNLNDVLARVLAGDSTYVTGLDFGYLILAHDGSGRISSLIKECEERIAAIDRASRARVATRRAKNAKYAYHKALSAAYLGLTRTQATVVKRLLQEQRKDTCPYCERPIHGKVHADHIYPVSLGGLSVEENMILICADWNIRKSNKTLREFCRDSGVNFQTLEGRLSQLKKKF